MPPSWALPTLRTRAVAVAVAAVDVAAVAVPVAAVDVPVAAVSVYGDVQWKYRLNQKLAPLNYSA